MTPQARFMMLSVPVRHQATTRLPFQALISSLESLAPSRAGAPAVSSAMLHGAGKRENNLVRLVLALVCDSHPGQNYYSSSVTQASTWYSASHSRIR